MKDDLNLSLVSFLSLPAEIDSFFKKPWSIFTYIFVHENIFHVVLNLSFFLIVRNLHIKINEDFKIITILFLSAIFSGFLFIFFYNIFLILKIKKEITFLIGSSSAIMGLFSFYTFRYPNRFINLFSYKINIKYILILLTLLSLASISKFNTGGNISHIGAIIFGFFYHILTKKVIKNKRSFYYDDQIYRDKKRNKEKEVDDILEKISQSGYQSLTKAEKNKLFKLTKK